MNILNLNDLTVEKARSLTEINYEIQIDWSLPLLQVRSLLQDTIVNCLKEIPNGAVHYHFNIVNATPATDDDFISMVNTIEALFFMNITLGTGRNRERRLDVPEGLHACHVPSGVLKRAINHRTKLDYFNISIGCGDFYFVMCEDAAYDA